MNGKNLNDAICSAAVIIDQQHERIDELNVYPVPDGDTGTNMSMTMTAARQELLNMPFNATIDEVADVAASAMLRGARGNSGVILSQLFRGFANGLTGLNFKTVTSQDIANAWDFGVTTAYNAVMKPTEGTILTVARVSADAAKDAAAKTNDPVKVWEAMCTAAEEALAHTPEQLPILKKAGVVDAGGKGLLLIWNAMLDVFHGETPAVSQTDTDHEAGNIAIGRIDLEEEINFTYCTEFIVEKTENCPPASELRNYLAEIGDCVVVVDDAKIIKVHVHTDQPDKALGKALTFGRFVNNPKPKIENMRIQHEEQMRKQEAVKKITADFGFVAVAAGDGIENMFRSMGVDQIVKGGQTMNPSAEDIATAITATNAEHVFVFPNNKNIILTAQQAASLVKTNVHVIPTVTIPQGFAAMMSFDNAMTAKENEAGMQDAAQTVQTGHITFASRDAELDGQSIHQNEILALNSGKLSFTDTDINTAAKKLIQELTKDATFLTIIYGENTSEETAQALYQELKQTLKNIDIQLINGGQPVYYYILSAE